MNLTKVFYTYEPNLVILAWTGDELSRGQTLGRTQATTIPEGQYWPGVKQLVSNKLTSVFDQTTSVSNDLNPVFQ